MGSVLKWSYGGRDHYWLFSCLSILFFSSLDLGPVQIALAWVFTTLGVTSGGGFSPHAGSAEWSPWSCTDQLWDLSVRTIAYIE